MTIASPAAQRAWSLEGTANMAAPALILLTPFVTYLRHHSYDLLAPEALLCIAALVAAGMAISAIVTVRPSILRPLVLFGMLIPWLLAPVVAALFAVSNAAVVWAGLAIDGSAMSTQIAYGASGLFGLVLLVLFWMLRRHIGLIVAAAFGVMLIVAAFEPGGHGDKSTKLFAGPPPLQDLPPIVHLILDEHIGVAGIPDDVEGAAELKEKIVAFYGRHGFRLYTRAFSHYWNTTDSISNLLNGTVAPLFFAQVDSQNTLRLSNNRWFRALRDRGYRIEVLQTDHLDYCAAGGVAACSTYLANSIATLRDEQRVGRLTAALAIMYSYQSRSRFYQVSGVAYERAIRSPAAYFNLDLPAWRWDRMVVGPLLATRAIDDLAEAVTRAPNGRAFFAHVMLPHGSYMFDSTCAVLANAFAWRDHGDSLRRPPAANSANDRAVRYVRYLQQVECTYRFIDKVLQALHDTGALQRAIVLVHGDHGSRIGSRDALASWRDLLSKRDILDYYSALYAIRAPGIEPGVSSEVVSIQALFAEQMLEDPPSPRSHRVYLPPANARPLAPLSVRAIDFNGDAAHPATAAAPEPVRTDIPRR